MGIFDETRTYIASSTLQLVEQTPNIIQQSILNSVLAGRDIVPDIIDATLGSFAVKDVAKMYRYARDEYVNGLPEGSKGWAPAPTETIEDVLAKEFASHTAAGRTFRVLTASLGNPNHHFIGIECFANDSRLKSWRRWGEPDSTGQIFWSGDFKYSTNPQWDSFQLGSTQFHREGYKVYIEGRRGGFSGMTRWWWGYNNYHEPIVSNGIYYSVEYEILNPNGSVYIDFRWPRGKRFWSYYPKSKRYPELNLEEDSGGVPTGTFYFPVVPLRVNNTELNNKGTALYKTSKKLLNYLEVDIDELHDAVLANPSISDIDHAYVLFGVDVHTKTEAGIKYLYEYFEDEHNRQTVNKTQYLNWFHAPKFRHPPLNGVVIKDATYNVTLVFSYISITEADGVIGQEGYVDKRISIYDKNPQTSRPAGSRQMQYEDHRNGLFLRKQVTPTRVRTIEVGGLCLANNVHGSGKSWWTGLWGAVNLTGEDQHNAPIPVPLNIAISYDSLPKLVANPLYYESLHIVFNSFEVVKLKWYETSFFRWFTQVIALAVGVMTGGMGNLIAGITTAISAGLTAVTVFIGEMLIKSLLAQYAFKFAAEQVGLEATLVLTAALSAYGVVGHEGMLNLPFATDLLFIGTALMEAAQGFVMGATADVMEQMEDLNAEYETKQEELANINKELSATNQLDPLGLYTQVGMLPTDTPSSYIERSLMVNQGLESITAVSQFVENSLRLPQRI